MNKKDEAAKAIISFQKIISSCIFTIVVIIQIMICWYNYHLCKERQHILKVMSKANVYNGWDTFSSDKPKLLAQLHSPSEFRVLGIYSGIDSGGVKIKLPDGKIAYTHIFDENTDVELYKNTDFISIILFFTMFISSLFFVGSLYKDVPLPYKFIFAFSLLIYSIGITVLLNQGVI